MNTICRDRDRSARRDKDIATKTVCDERSRQRAACERQVRAAGAAAIYGPCSAAANVQRSGHDLNWRREGTRTRWRTGGISDTRSRYLRPHRQRSGQREKEKDAFHNGRSSRTTLSNCGAARTAAGLIMMTNGCDVVLLTLSVT
jgi:hypothetical protein